MTIDESSVRVALNTQRFTHLEVWISDSHSPLFAVDDCNMFLLRIKSTQLVVKLLSRILIIVLLLVCFIHILMVF